MIRAEFVVSDDGIQGFSMKGHAGTAPAPHDILCASATSMALLVMNTLREVFGAKLTIESQEEPPVLNVRLQAVPKGNEKAAQGVLQGFRLQLEDLEKQYPNNLKTGGKSR